MISIRLKKNSYKKFPSFSIIVVSAAQSPRSGKFIKKIGFYKPLADTWSTKYLFLNIEQLLY
jgi:ribosomal protein S16